MKGPQASSAEVIRHRLLEGVLLGLARLPEVDHFILRGGMLMRLWFRPLARPAADLDLVSALPFSVEETARKFAPLLADRSVGDGVTFDAERFRVEGIWLNSDYPGVRVFASGEAEGVEDEFTVDVTFGEPLVPEPEPGEYPVPGRGLTARLRMCRPETITGRKLHALMDMGVLHWRPKDLNDLRLLLGRVPMDAAELPEAITLSFTSRGNTPADARTVFGRDSWWAMKMSRARWHDFVKESRGQEVPGDLARVVAEIAERLKPVLEQLP
jgi:hypothetical protein